MAKRPLTKGERALASMIFKDSIDYDLVKISNRPYSPFQGKDVTMAPNGNLYCNSTYRDDFSKCSNHMQSHFIHEMTHIWQYQNRVINPVWGAAKEMLKHKFNYASAYKYKIDTSKDFTDYGLEQQACIIGDYFSLKNNQLTCASPKETREAFEAILSKFLKNPSYAKRPHIVKRIFGWKK